MLVKTMHSNNCRRVPGSYTIAYEDIYMYAKQVISCPMLFDAFLMSWGRERRDQPKLYL